jgi:hypothetical protein
MLTARMTFHILVATDMVDWREKAEYAGNEMERLFSILEKQSTEPKKQQVMNRRKRTVKRLRSRKAVAHACPCER